jgi:DNA-directed RNA polymerase subunit omega
MVHRRTTLIDPPIEDLLDKVDSKFTLVSLSAKRARQINSYYNQLGEGFGVVVPPQVASVSGKPLTIAFEEIASAKATYHHPEPGDEADNPEDPGELAELGVPAAGDVVDSVMDLEATGDAPATDEEPPGPGGGAGE